jgi:SAM-dependent methyltransferase
MDAFKYGAPFYEAFSNAVGRLAREKDLLLRLLAQTPEKRVLDLACGTGLHAHFMAEHGATVRANDISDAMIAHARRVRPHERIAYGVHDMREGQADSFDLVLCLGNSLSLLASQQELCRALAHIAQTLSDGGVFLLQVVNYALPKNQKPRCRVEQRSVEGMDVVAVKCLAPRGDRTYLTLNYFANDGERTDSIAESAVLQNLYYDLLKTAIEKAGLTIVATYGSFDEQAYDPAKSNDLLIECAPKI